MPGYSTNENERIPESYMGSFSYLPPQAFANFTTKRTIKVPWSERFDTIKTILGWSEHDPESDPPSIVRYLPWNDWDDPLLIASRCEVVGKSYAGSTLNLAGPPMQSGNLYEFAWVDVYFAAPRFALGERLEATGQVGASYENEAVRFCTKEVKPGVELVTAKLPSFKYGDGAGEQILFPLPITFSFEDTVVNWWAVPLDAVPNDAIRECVGKVNDATAVLPDIPKPGSYEAETLKLQTYQFTDCWLTSGGSGDVPVRGVHVTYFFKYRGKDQFGKGGWNYYPDTTGALRPVVRISDTAEGPYLTADFSKLFKAAT